MCNAVAEPHSSRESAYTPGITGCTGGTPTCRYGLAVSISRERSIVLAGKSYQAKIRAWKRIAHTEMPRIIAARLTLRLAGLQLSRRLEHSVYPRGLSAGIS